MRIEDFCRRWDVAELALFGSLARGDAQEDSDADVLVTFRDGARPSAHDHFAMTGQLREIFGRKVDLVQERLLDNPFRRHNILLDKKVLFPRRTLRIEEIRDGTRRFDRDISLIWDVVQAGQRLARVTRDKNFDQYMSDDLLRLAVERLLITIGEAARGFSETFRFAHPEIAWSEIIGEGNLLVHQYSRIDDETVWTIATTHVPRLVADLEPLLP
jgi:uncharacterized protein with HEPN domain/predicted nucleotidyltransferase